MASSTYDVMCDRIDDNIALHHGPDDDLALPRSHQLTIMPGKATLPALHKDRLPNQSILPFSVLVMTLSLDLQSQFNSAGTLKAFVHKDAMSTYCCAVEPSTQRVQLHSHHMDDGAPA